jgi:hypothetical protein
LLTVGEVAALCARLTGEACTPRQVRYLLVGCRLGTEPERRRNGQTRLHGAVDVALVRLALRLHAEGVSPWVARVVLTYLRNDVIRAWRAGSAVTLAVTGIQGSLDPSLKPKPAGAVACVSLREMWHGLETELQRVCAARSAVWMWRDVPVHAVPRATA